MLSSILTRESSREHKRIPGEIGQRRNKLFAHEEGSGQLSFTKARVLGKRMDLRILFSVSLPLPLLVSLSSFYFSLSLALLALLLSVASYLSPSLPPFFFVALRFAKVQRRGLPVVDDQRGFPFSTPCCCAAAATAAAPSPFSSLPSSSLFSRTLGTTGMIILREKIWR